MTKKIWLPALTSMALITVIFICGCLIDTKIAYNKFSAFDDDSYQTLTIKINDWWFNDESEKGLKSENCVLLDVSISEKAYLDLYPTQEWTNSPDSTSDIQLSYYKSHRFIIVKENRIRLEENGFFEAADKNAVITIKTHPYICWDGWSFPVVSVEMEGVCYLDFETGKENWLNYLCEA